MKGAETEESMAFHQSERLIFPLIFLTNETSMGPIDIPVNLSLEAFIQELRFMQ